MMAGSVASASTLFLVVLNDLIGGTAIKGVLGVLGVVSSLSEMESFEFGFLVMVLLLPLLPLFPLTVSESIHFSVVFCMVSSFAAGSLLAGWSLRRGRAGAGWITGLDLGGVELKMG